MFGRLVRWRATEGRTPGEDRLTEVFAAVLERVPGLALDLARRWVDPESSAAGERATRDTSALAARLAPLPADVLPRVATQVAVDGRRRVDLELRFPSEPRGPLDLVLRVEVKHGTNPHSEQIPAYIATMPMGTRGSDVVLLAPRADLPVTDTAQVPASVPQRSWQATARAIRAFRADSEVDAWLCEELATYLFQEHLMDPEALRPEHLTALAYYDEATAGLAVICQRAAEHMHDAIGPPDGQEPTRVKYGVGYSAWWDKPPAWDRNRWDSAWFDWGIRAANPAAAMTAIHVFAGLSVERPNTFRPEWIADLHSFSPAAAAGTVAEAMCFRPWSGNSRRLHRFAAPQDVLVGPTLEAQGDSLGRWLLQTYRALQTYMPRPSSTARIES